MIFEFDVYKEKQGGYLIASSKYAGLCGYSPNLKELKKNAEDIAGLFEFDFPEGKNDSFGMPFVKKIKVEIDIPKKI